MKLLLVLLNLLGFAVGSTNEQVRSRQLQAGLTDIAVFCPGAANLGPIITELEDPDEPTITNILSPFPDPLELLACVANVVLTPPSQCDVSVAPTIAEAQTCFANFIADQVTSGSLADFVSALVPDSGPVTSDGAGSGNEIPPGALPVLENCTLSLGTFGCTMLISAEERAALEAASPDQAQLAIIQSASCMFGTVDALIDFILDNQGTDPFGSFDAVELLRDLPSGVDQGIFDACAADAETSAFYQELSVRRTEAPTSAAPTQAYAFLPLLVALGITAIN